MLKTFKYDNDSVRLLKKIHTLIIERKFIIFSPFLKKAHNSNKTSSGTHTHRLAIVITVTDCNCKLPSTMIIQSVRFYFYWQKIRFFYLINKNEAIDQTMDGYNFFCRKLVISSSTLRSLISTTIENSHIQTSGSTQNNSEAMREGMGVLQIFVLGSSKLH